MDKLVPIVNKLQTVLASFISNEKLELPHIAVVGSQSVGKTSLLESLVKLDFMPKGEGIVTRTPIILQLVNVKDGEAFCVVSYLDKDNNKVEERMSDFSALNELLVRVTDEITGGSKCVKENPIFVEIHSKHVLDITLIDLPGLTKVPVGNQPANVEEQISNLVYKYIKNPNCIILAVSCANIDLANSDSLKIARSVDPQHTRTIGVITKCDMVDKAEIWKRMVSGNIYPLKKGFVAVVCRSQKDVDDNLSLEESLKKEKEYFSRNIDPSNPSECLLECGVHNLAKKLNTILIEHVKNTVPHLKPRIESLKNMEEEKLLALGEPMEAVNKSECLSALVNFITKFSQQYQDIIDGKIFYKDKVDELKGGARIHYIFNDWYIKSLNEFVPLDILPDEEIRIAIRNASGPRGALFVPECAFETLIKKLINCLKEPSLRCADQVYEELIRIVDNCTLSDLDRFEKLKNVITEHVKTLLKDCLAPTKDMIKNLISMELSYINTSHPDFINDSYLKNMYDENEDFENDSYDNNVINGKHKTIQLELNNVNYNSSSYKNTRKPYSNNMGNVTGTKLIGGGRPSGLNDNNLGRKNQLSEYIDNHNSLSGTGVMQNVTKLNTSILQSVGNFKENRIFNLPSIPERIIPAHSASSKELIEIDLIKSLINNYFNIVRKHIADAVPKAIMHFMVNTSRKTMQKVLISNLHNDELFDLFTECPTTKMRRTTCKKNLDALNHAIQILTEIRNHDL